MAHGFLNARIALIALGLGAACSPAAAFAQSAGQSAVQPSASQPTAPAASDTVRLSDAERMAILDSNTEASVAAARGESEQPVRLDRGVHGELGMMIGSNGTRGAYGTAAIPLGDNAGAVISFESTRFGYRR